MKKLNRVGIYLWIVLLVIIDQGIKFAVINSIKDNSITIIKGILKFLYCENRGAAFSIGNGHVPVFIVVNIIIILGMVFYYESNRNEINIYEKVFFTMVIAGGTSNLIDRVIRGYVVDFIDVSQLLDFPIFNIADIFIVLGVIGLVISIAFQGMRTCKK